MNIKKKITALSIICAMLISAAGCSDKDPSSSSSSDSSSAEKNHAAADEIQVQTSLSPEEVEKLEKHPLEFSLVTVDPNNLPDAVEQAVDGSNGNGNAQGGNSGGSGNAQGGNSGGSGNAQDGNSGGNGNAQNGNSGGDGNAQNGGSGDNANNQNGNSGGNGNAQNGNSDNNGSQNGGSPITGTPETQQVFWMDLSKKADFAFDGDFLTATFKIKDDAAAGTYPVTVEWMDFSNYKADPISHTMTSVNGVVGVGTDVSPNSFKNTGNCEIMAENISGNPGDTVTVTFKIQNNPGFVAFLFRFGYDSDVLEFVSGDSGADFENAIE